MIGFDDPDLPLALLVAVAGFGDLVDVLAVVWYFAAGFLAVVFLAAGFLARLGRLRGRLLGRWSSWRLLAGGLAVSPLQPGGCLAG